MTEAEQIAALRDLAESPWPEGLRGGLTQALDIIEEQQQHIAALRDLSETFPEINPGNYGDNEVTDLNNWGIAICQIIDQLAAAPPLRQDGYGGQAAQPQSGGDAKHIRALAAIRDTYKLNHTSKYCYLVAQNALHLTGQPPETLEDLSDAKLSGDTP